MPKTKKRFAPTNPCVLLGGRDILRCVMTGRAVTYGGVLSNAGGGLIGIWFPTMNASFILKMRIFIEQRN